MKLKEEKVHSLNPHEKHLLSRALDRVEAGVSIYNLQAKVAHVQHKPGHYMTTILPDYWDGQSLGFMANTHAIGATSP